MADMHCSGEEQVKWKESDYLASNRVGISTALAANNGPNTLLSTSERITHYSTRVHLIPSTLGLRLMKNATRRHTCLSYCHTRLILLWPLYTWRSPRDTCHFSSGL